MPTPLASFSDRVSSNLQISVQGFNTSAPPVLGDPVSSTTESVRIVLFGPVNGELNGIASGDFALSATPTPVSFIFPVTIGPRAVQAFQFDASKQITRRSPITYVTIPAGGLPPQTLILQ